MLKFKGPRILLKHTLSAATIFFFFLSEFRFIAQGAVIEIWNTSKEFHNLLKGENNKLKIFNIQDIILSERTKFEWMERTKSCVLNFNYYIFILKTQICNRKKIIRKKCINIIFLKCYTSWYLHVKKILASQNFSFIFFAFYIYPHFLNYTLKIVLNNQITFCNSLKIFGRYFFYF